MVRVVFLDEELSGRTGLVQCQGIDSSVLVILFVELMKKSGWGHVFEYISLELLIIFLATAKRRENNCTIQQNNSIRKYLIPHMSRTQL